VRSAVVGRFVQTYTYDIDSPRRRHMVKTFQDGSGRTAVVHTFGAVATQDPPTFEEEEIERRITIQQIGDEKVTIDYAPAGCTAARCTTTSREIYDDQSQLIETAVTQYEYDASGYPTQIIDALGHKRTTVYEAGRPYPTTFITERNIGTPASPNLQLQKTVSVVYNADGQLASRSVVLDSNDKVVESWLYDAGRHSTGWVSEYKVTRDIGNNGSIDETFRTDYTFYREDTDEPPNGIDPNDPVTNIHTIARLVSEGPEVTETTELFYNGHGRIAKLKLPDGHEIDWSHYDATVLPDGFIRHGFVNEIMHSTSDHQKVTYDYDEQGMVASITDSLTLPRTTQLIWDAGGRIQEIQNAASESTVFTYGGPGATPTAAGDYLVEREDGKKTGQPGRLTQYRYDGDGNLETIDRQDDPAPTFLRTWTFTYDSEGRRLSQTDASSRLFTATYDALGRVTSVKDSLNPAVTFDYDATGNRTEVVDARSNPTDFTYDDLGRLIEVLQKGVPQFLSTEFTYDAVGNVLTVDDPKDQTTTYAYDGLSRLLAVTQPTGPPLTVSYCYDARSRLSRVTNARGHGLEYSYLPWGGLEKVEHADTAGATCTDPSSAAVRTVSYTYDLAGNLLSAKDDTQLTQAVVNGTDYPAQRLYSYTYDVLNRVDLATAHHLFSTTTGEGRSLDADYNRFGERTDLNLSGNGENLDHQWRFNDLGRLTGTVFPPDPVSNPTPTVGLTYFDNGDLDTLTHANALTSAHLYFAHGPLQSIEVGSTLHKLVYSVDPSWNITGIDETHTSPTPVHTYTYPYDGVNRLAGTVNYPTGLGLPASDMLDYDDAGNRDDDAGASTPWAYDANNRIQTSPNPQGGSDLAYAFDADGNLCKTNPGGITTPGDPCVDDSTNQPNEVRFVFDKTNRLREIHKPDDSFITYAYDPFGRRTEKSVDPDGVAGPTLPTVTHFLWDGDQLLAEYDDTGARQVRYAYAGGFAPVQVAYGSPTETIYEVHTDHLDTPRMLTDVGGTVVWRAAYEAYGKIHLDPGNTLVEDFNVRFPGQYYDGESGLHYNGFRYYDPGIGTYVSADPIAQAGGINVFTYAGWAPISLMDPEGLVLEYGGTSPEAKEFIRDDAKEAREYFASGGVDDPLDDLEDSEATYTITYTPGKSRYSLEEQTIYWNSNAGWVPENMCGEGQSPALGLLHEGEHARAHDDDPVGLIGRRGDPTDDKGRWTDAEERRIISGPESEAASSLGETKRDTHAGGLGNVRCVKCVPNSR
jgi:RHS repeat-associated protein